MPELALGLMALYLVLAFGVRIAIQLRRTGSTGISSLRGAPPIELLGGGVFAAAVVLGAATPLLVVLDALEPFDWADRTPVHLAGLLLCLTGIAGTFAAQMAMGSSWRIGVDPAESPKLVSGGVFEVCRNPVYAFMILAWAGFTLLVPSWTALAADLLLIAGLEIQVRLVEEPHLLRSHGEAYREYGQRVGRFLPGIGTFERGASERGAFERGASERGA